MKLKRLKNHLKIGSLLFGIFIVILACEKETIDNNEEQLQEKRLQKISINQLNNRIGKSKDFENLSKAFDINRQKSNQLNRLEENDNPWLMTDEIAMIEKNNVTYYTFRVGTETESDEFYNVVVVFDELGNILSNRLLEYTPSQAWLQDTSQPFVGEIKLQKNNFFTADYISNLSNTRSNGQCISFVETQWVCNAGENHAPDTCTAGGSELVIVIHYEPCSGGGGSGNNSDDGYIDGNSTGGGGSSGGSSSNNNDDDCIPSVDNPCNQDDTTIMPPRDNEEDEDCDTSKEDLKKVFPNMSDTDAELLASVINDKGTDFGIDSDEDLWHFLSQAGHETGGFNTLSTTESTYWTTASKLANTYKKFTMDSTLAANNNDKYYAPDYLQNSSGVANVAMCCKYGNGNVASGDGYKYRGRGLFQLTWKDNYSAFKTWYNNKYDPDIDPVTTPSIIASNDTLAILSGLWYYKTRVVDKITIDSTTSVSKVTKPINAAKKGLADRNQRFQKAKDSINCL